MKKDRIIEINNIKLKCIIKGEGPLIILLHGMPTCWMLWKNQIDPLVKAGYTIAIPDQRGCGGSSCPDNINDYNILNLTSDIVGIADKLGYDKFIVIGHDWGSYVAFNTALLYEDRCQAVMGMSAPFWRTPEKDKNPLIHPKGMDDQFWYIRYFQEFDLAENELKENVYKSLLKLYYSLSADSPPLSFVNQLSFPKESKFLDTLKIPEVKETLSWLNPSEFEYLIDQYQKTGFKGCINWYRNIENNNLITHHIKDKKFSQPAAFIAGSEEDVLQFSPKWKETFSKAFNDLRFIKIVNGSGHYLPLEKPVETSELILTFLKGL